MMQRKVFVILATTIAGFTYPALETANYETQTNLEHQPVSDPKTECEDIMNEILPFAEEMLTKHREFLPFGGTMATDGEISHTGGWTDDEHPASTEVSELLENGFRAGAARGEFKATALVYDIRTVPPGKEEKQDAIAVALDHRNNYSVVVIFPYLFMPDGQLEIASPFATKGENKIFTNMATEQGGEPERE